MAAQSFVPVAIGLLVAVASAERAPVRVAADVEPNDTLATATETGLVDLGTAVVSGGVVGNGTLNEADRDLYAIEVSDEAELPLLLTVGMETSDDGFDGYLRVFDANGAEIARHDDVEYPNLDPLLHTYLLEPGTYYVAASHALNPNYDPADETTGRSAGTGAYDLAIIVAPAPSLADSLEPPAGASTTVDVAHYSFRNQFIGDGTDLRMDADGYAVQIDGPSILTVEVRPAGLRALDPFLSVFVPDKIVPNETMRPDLRRQRIEVAVFEAGTVSVVVRGTLGPLDELNPRFGTVGFYDLDIDVTPVNSGGGPLEPNDSLLEATPIGLTDFWQITFFSAFIGDGKFGDFRGDVDFFEIDLRLQEVITIDVVPGQEDLEPVVHLYDYLGRRLDTFYANAAGEIHGSHERRCTEILFLSGFPDDIEEPISIAVMGIRDRLTMDPLIPNLSLQEHGQDPHSPALALHSLDGGPGSTGTYDVTFTLSNGILPACGLEPDDSIPDVATPVLVNEGTYTCVSGALNDGSCAEQEANIDLIKVRLDSSPATLEVRLLAARCGDARAIRLFDENGQELAAAFERAFQGVTIRTELEKPGEYFLGVSAVTNMDYDPFVPCSGSGDFGFNPRDYYELDIRLFAQEVAATARTRKTNTAGTGDNGGRLFGTLLEFTSDTIAELDPRSGEVTNRIPAPEAPLRGAEGLTIDGDDLLILGRSGRFPFLYRLDPDTGEVVDRVLTWFGSGIYGGVIQLAGTLYIVDIVQNVIHRVSTNLSGPVAQIDVGASAGVAMFGPVIATAPQNRLIVVDAANPSQLHEIDVNTGQLVISTRLGSPCSCDADFDRDGDVDDDDTAWFSACDAISGVSFGCRAADLNCDHDIDQTDTDILTCQHNGSDKPPGENCCPTEHNTTPIRATSLGSANANVLLAGDWATDSLNRFTRSGFWLGENPIDAPVGALTGSPLILAGDWNADEDLDLLDWRALQFCFARNDPTQSDPLCNLFDFNADGDVDLTDYGLFQMASLEIGQ